MCGRVHHPIPLRFGERALCADCGSTLDRHTPGQPVAIALTVTALILAIPALQLPVVIVRKFGAARASYLWSGVGALWQNQLPLLSVWVAVCGLVVPAALLATLTAFALHERFGRSVMPGKLWLRTARALQHWSMPEVNVLAVLVAFVKIGALVQVEPGLGLWFYAAMAGTTLLAWRCAEQLDLTV